MKSYHLSWFKVVAILWACILCAVKGQEQFTTVAALQNKMIELCDASTDPVLTAQSIGQLDTSQMTSFRYLFSPSRSDLWYHCTNAELAGIGNWNTTAVTDFEGMFGGASSFDQDISTWDVSSGINFSYMFYYASSFNGVISNWDVSSGTSFSGMFWYATSFDQDISNWDVSSGTIFSYMFYYAFTFNRDISSWDVSSGTSFYGIFYEATSFVRDIGCWWNISPTADTVNMCYNSCTQNNSCKPSSVPSVAPTGTPTKLPSSAPTSSPTLKPSTFSSATFFITSSYEFDESDSLWCLQAKTLTLRSAFNMRPCTGVSEQLFYYDDLGQIRLRDSPSMCMKYKKKKLFLGQCNDTAAKKKTIFAIDAVAGTITAEKKNRNFLVCVKPEDKFEKVRLYSSTGNVNDSCYSWSFQLGASA